MTDLEEGNSCNYHRPGPAWPRGKGEEESVRPATDEAGRITDDNWRIGVVSRLMESRGRPVVWVDKMALMISHSVKNIIDFLHSV